MKLITLLGLVGATLGISVRPALGVEFDDPVASLSKYDDLDSILNSAYPFHRVEMVIHACTYGSKGLDSKYARHQAQLKHLNLMWGAFVFAHKETNAKGETVEAPEAQALHFVREVARHSGTPDDHVLLSVNWFWYRDNKSASPHAIAMICGEVHRLTGKWPVLFADIDLLKTVLDAQKNADRWSAEDIQVLSNCPLWLGYIDTEEIFPPTFPSNSPWQTWTFCLHSSRDYPHTIAKELPENALPPDLSSFNGTRGAMLKDWYEQHAWDYRPRVDLE